MIGVSTATHSVPNSVPRNEAWFATKMASAPLPCLASG